MSQDLENRFHSLQADLGHRLKLIFSYDRGLVVPTYLTEVGERWRRLLAHRDQLE